jgi:NAD(P)-dependent dehydrogenase (short-subunit alcohol dehydrogenase family)
MVSFSDAVTRAGLDVELLVCNSGINIKGAAMHEVDPEEFDRLMKTNVYGVFYTMRAFVPRMVAMSTTTTTTTGSSVSDSSTKHRNQNLKRVIGISSGLGHSTSHKLGS